MSKKIISLLSFVTIIALMSAGSRWLIRRYTLGQALIIGVSISLVGVFATYLVKWLKGQIKQNQE